MDKKIHIGQVITYSGAVTAYLIGSGFASGQEILQFFTSYGLWGSLGALLISMVLFVWLGVTLMNDGNRLGYTRASQILSYYCGNKLGKFFEWFTAVFLYLIFVVMISGSGAILHEYYGINRMAGSIVMAVLALVTVLFGLDSIVNVVGRIGPLIIAMAIAIGTAGFISKFGQLKYADSLLAAHPVPRAAGHWALSGVLYAAFCCVTMVPFLSGMGARAKNKRDALWGGASGGFFFVLAATALSLAMLASVDLIYGMEAPSLVVADQLIPGLGAVFSVVLILGIYTTAVPMLWTSCNHIESDEKGMKFRLTAIIGTVAACFGGQLSFSTLVNIVYPYSGYLGLILMACIAYRQIQRKRDEKTRC